MKFYPVTALTGLAKMAKFQAQWHTPIAVLKHREKIYEKLEKCELVSDGANFFNCNSDCISF